jgi:hypothetical protein
MNSPYRDVQSYVRFEVFTAVTKKNTFFLDVTKCGSYDNRRSRGTYRLHHQGERTQRARKNVSSNWQLKNVELTDLTRVTRRNTLEDGILYSHRRENFKSYWLGSVEEAYCVSCEVRTGFLYPKDGILHSHRRENLKSYMC